MITIKGVYKMKHLLYTGSFSINGAIKTVEHDLPSLDTVLKQWADETNYKGSLSELKVVTVSAVDFIHAHEHINHLTDVFYELTDLMGSCQRTDSLLIITQYPSLDLKKFLPENVMEIIDEHFHTINNYKQYFNSWGELKK